MRARAGVRHVRSEVRAQGVERFDEHAALLAFHMNGDTSAMRAIQPLELEAPGGLPRLQGGGGPLLRGYHYPPAPLSRLPLPPRAVVAWLRSWSGRLSSLPWETRELMRGVVERLEGSVYTNLGLTNDACDLIDLFHMHERFAFWGALGSRSTWKELATPFRSPAVMELAWQLPSPRGRYARVHETLIRRHVSESLYIPMNGRVLLPLIDPTPETLRPLVELATARWFEIGRQTRWAERQKAQWILRSEAVAGPLGDRFEDMLGARDSIATTLMGSAGVRRLLDEHMGRKCHHMQTLCNMVTMEYWREQILEAKRTASPCADISCPVASVRAMAQSEPYGLAHVLSTIPYDRPWSGRVRGIEEGAGRGWARRKISARYRPLGHIRTRIARPSFARAGLRTDPDGALAR